MPSALTVSPRSRWFLTRGFSFAVICLACVTLALVVTTLQRRATQGRASSEAALELIVKLRTLDGLEWRIAAEEPADEVLPQIETVIDSMELDLRRGNFSDVDPTIEVAVAQYVDDVTAFVAALVEGDQELAEEIDETRIDPHFDEVIERMSGLSLEYRGRAETDEWTARRLTWIATAVSAACLSVLLLGGAALRDRRRRAALDQRFQALVESSRDVVTVADHDGLTIVSSQGGWLAAIGAQGQKLSPEAMPESIREAWKAADDLLRASGDHQTIEIAHQHADGASMWLEAVGTPLEGSPGERVWVWRDVSRRKELEVQLTHQAFHDSLTGVANRSLLRDRLDHALSMAERTASPVTLLFCDLDGFKTVNDSLGHSIGDELLSVICKRLAGCIRTSDTLARLGGDEFAILLEGADADKGVALAERLLSVVGYQVEVAGRVLFPSMSIGIATATPGATTEELLRNADLAMYSAKRAGKGCAELYHDRLQEITADQLELQHDLALAIGADQLTLNFQPTVDLETGAVEGVEALLRWHHPKRGMVLPDQFIPIAESSGMIVAIGRWVIFAACQAAVQLSESRDGRPLLMHVNVSPFQLHDQSFTKTVSDALQVSGLAAEYLVLEVTEGSLLDNPLAVQRLHDVSALGVKIAIDDFGTGYTSINYLQQLPAHILKIDRSFVSGDALPATERNAFLNAILGLARSLNMHSVAEGIEDTDQLDELRTLGCDSGQGFLWSPAKSLELTHQAILDIEAPSAINVR